ncbi:MAG TPA: DUF3073 domain-containing protein [Mycobacteriales bacterium]|nr:DUF3073 domain-containing protein [Mycobacteriales bacterium]
MGRGRAKAKQTKVARELKYSGGSLDPDRLKAELAAGSPFPVASPSPAASDGDDEDEFADPYADAFDDGDEDAPAR